jgi:hypothetical protein
VEIELVINQTFKQKMSELRAYANSKSEELKSPILRLMQIEEKLNKLAQVS